MRSTAPPARARSLARLLELVLAAIFIGAGLAKLGALPSMVALFAAVGAGQWFRILIGLFELAGGVLLCVPRYAALSALALIGMMGGAMATTILVLHTSPLVPGVVLVSLCIVARTRRGELLSWWRRAASRRTAAD